MSKIISVTESTEPISGLSAFFYIIAGGGVDEVTKPNWGKIREEWETTEITFKALAEKYGLSDSTVRSRKNREKWQRNATSNATEKKKDVATKKPKKKKAAKVKEPVVIENDELNDRQRLFCIYYLKYFNATKAYQKAYECAYSTAMVNGSRMLGNTKISSEIERIREEQTSELKLGIREILQKYIDIAFADITDFVEFGQKPKRQAVDVDEEGEPIYVDTEESYNYFNLKNSSEIDGSILTEVKEGKEGITVKLADKMKALDVLTKYFDMLSNSDQEKLRLEKLKAETEFTKERTKLLKGEKKDTSMLEQFLEGDSQYKEMAEKGAFKEFIKGDSDG